jgi:hypothetical protein
MTRHLDEEGARTRWVKRLAVIVLAGGLFVAANFVFARLLQLLDHVLTGR